MLNPKEQEIANRLQVLKEASGSHSPSIQSIQASIPEIPIRIDACFLSNPYATDLFMEYLKREILQTGRLREVLEYYPTQNQLLASELAPLLDVHVNSIFIGNGATEIIQALLHRFTKKRLLVNIPTFSPYYEFARPDTEVFTFQLPKEEYFALNIDNLIAYAKEIQPDTIILINPNNPDGNYVPVEKVSELIGALPFVEQFILDESFIHFAYEDETFKPVTWMPLRFMHPNVTIVKSMSKDFGIAGIRAGYAIMSPSRVQELLKNGYLWNVSGLAEYFFRTFAKSDFQEAYEKVRKQYIQETIIFYHQLRDIPGIRVYPSKSNFYLIELLSGLHANEVVIKMLMNHGVYLRSCSDKVGLEGQFIRVASRKQPENELITQSLSATLLDYVAL